MKVAGAHFLIGIDAAIRELEKFIKMLGQHEPAVIYYVRDGGEEVELIINGNKEEHVAYLDRLKQQRGAMLGTIPQAALDRITERINKEIEDQTEE